MKNNKAEYNQDLLYMLFCLGDSSGIFKLNL
jgi:hypothetical protein